MSPIRTFRVLLFVVISLVAIATGARAQTCTAPPPGLVSWYRMEGVPTDWFGRNDPSSTSAISYVAGEVGQGVTYANGGFIDVPDSTSLTLQALTIDAWARPDGPGPNTGGMQVVAKNTNANDVSVVLSWSPDDGGRFAFDLNSPDTISTADAFPTGTFYHVAGTYDGATMRLYVNGVLEASRSIVKTIAYTPSIPWVIGANNPPARSIGFPRTWNGVLDELEIFDRALTQTEIAALYAAGTSGKCPCGDNVVEPTEACDDGNVVDGDGCDSNCTVTACGNGIITAGEQCDDGNVTPNDGCSATCQLDVCANLQALTGKSLWLRAGIGMTVDGSNFLSQWTDQSGLAHDATAAGAARPLYVAAGPGGCPAIRFNGSTTVMDVAGKLINSRNAFTVLVKSYTDSTGTSNQEIISNWSNPPNGYKGMFFGRRNGTQWAFTDDWTPATGSTILMNTNTAMTFRSSATNAEIFQNGLFQTQKGSNLTGNPGGLEIDENAPWVLGEQAAFNGEYLKGYVQEIVVFDRVLTDAERSLAEQCLAGCGVYVSVPQPTATPTAIPTATPTATSTATPTTTATSTPVPTPTVTPGPPAGSCANPIPVPPDGGMFTGSTTGRADDVAGECIFGASAPEAVYVWTPNATGFALVSTCGGTTNYPTILSVRSNGCTGVDEQCQGPNADCTFGARFYRYVTAGQPYAVIVDGLNGASGSYTLSITPPGYDVRAITGKKLLVKDNADHTKRKIVFLSKDPNIIADTNGDGSGIDPQAFGASLQIYNGNGGSDVDCFALPFWEEKNGTAFKYKDTTYTNGPCKIVQVKSGKLLKAVCQAKVKPIDYSLDEPSQGSIAVRFISGTITYCADFGGLIKKDSGTNPPIVGGKGQFAAKDAPAPLTCPTPPSTCP